MGYLSSLFLFSLIPGVFCKRISSSDSNLPFPLAPPSDEFCRTNTLGDDLYISFFKPCDFTFYKTSGSFKPDHFSCDSVDGTTVKIESRKVLMWPESCVAAGPRCYYLADYPDLSNFTTFDGSEYYSMAFPADATVASVDCTADFAEAQLFMENLPQELEDVAHSISFVGYVLLFAVLASIVACICCCCPWGRRRALPNYTLLPANHVHGYYSGEIVETATTLPQKHGSDATAKVVSFS